jgi:hypothetical protein
MRTQNQMVISARPALLPPQKPPPPPNKPARVTFAVAGTPVAGVAATINVSLDPGVVWRWVPQDLTYEPDPQVTYQQAVIRIDGAEVLRDGTAHGGAYAVTFARPGDHTVVVAGVVAGGEIVSLPATVHVRAAHPPAFTLTGPADGAVVDLNEAGGHVDVQLTTTADQYFPLTVTIVQGGQSTVASFTGTTYQQSVALAPMPLGARTITITCADPDGQATAKTRTVTGRDVSLPHLHVAFPPASANIVGDADGKVTVPMRGTTDDNQSGVAGGSATVGWALSPNAQPTTAIPDTPGDFSSWHADVPLTGFGAHTIHLWATDQAGNRMPEPLRIPVTVISSYLPGTLDERLDQREYLAALLSFAQEQIVLPGPPPAPLDTAALVAALRQPVDRLSQPLSAAADLGTRAINQLRVPVELLRTYIADQHTSTAPGAALERRYLDTAYASLLASHGTSYAELRLARGAGPAARQALATRLGVRLSAQPNDELDQLTLDGAVLSEKALETLFGLPATTAADPLRALPTPALLSWRLSALALLWGEQDQQPDLGRLFAALADPDMITASDVVTGPRGDPIRALLTARASDLDAYAGMLDGLRHGGANSAAGLSAMTGAALPGVDLADLEARAARGEDITAALDAAHLTRGGFLYLRTLARLAATGTLTAAEWQDAGAILTGAHKGSLAPAWRGQETGFTLSPDFFVLSDDAPTASPYRIDRRARAAWQSVLRRRTAQRNELAEATDRAVVEAERLALPILRDALLADVTTGGDPDTGERLSGLFLVDLLASGTVRTTRLRQGIESVQSLLSAKRSGELPPTHPAAAWTIKDFPAFTVAWAWIGELAGWQAATTAFLFPERNLDPTLLVPHADPAKPFDTFFDHVRGTGSFTGADANREAAVYLTAVGMAGTVGTYLDAHRSVDHQTKLRDLSKQQTPTVAREVFWAVPMMLAQRLQAAGDFQAALDWYWLLYPYDLGQPISIFDRINTETPRRPDLTFPAGWTTLLDPFTLAEGRSTPYTRYTVLSIIRCLLDFADAEFAQETDESVAHARSLYVTARRLLGSGRLVPQEPSNQGEPALPIPELELLRGRADMQLAKLRQGRNIAGTPRTPASTLTTVTQSSPYRFKTLMERARQLVAQAAQMEAGYLAALEKYDDRSLRVYDALKTIDLTAAQTTVAAGRTQEARDAVTAATAQQQRADTMAAAYGSAADTPLSKYESNLLDEYGQLRDLRNGIAAADTAIGVMQAASNASSLLDLVTSFGFKQGFEGGITVATVAKGVLEGLQNGVDQQIQANQLQAGIEQRRNELKLQKASAEQDSLVAAAQVVTARDQVVIAEQEQAVASLQHDQAVATLKFLNEQFTNPDLYLWMSTTLGSVYRYFLQQATAIARLAQAQLGFERAEPPQALIRGDYWQSPGQLTSSGGADRRGLTGAEQLAEDLARLDQYAVDSERRRLNLSQTFSLARLFPTDFLEFRRTGRFIFATPTALFDADFPGHYLRMIRQVRTSVVALVPPDRGIRATLSTSGISQVTTVRDGGYQDIAVRHQPALVALTSAVSASGVFELDMQSDMLLPFESSGVDTTWIFELPPAANPFDFSGIADVLITIDYTALQDEEYRNQVISRLNAARERGADRVLSLARDFPDDWYDLNNPVDPSVRSATLTLRASDFPPGVQGLATSSLVVQLVGAGPVPDAAITLTRGAVGGDALTTGGVAGTRRGNATAWTPLIGSDPTGEWTLSFTGAAGDLFADGLLDDIVLIVSWTGTAPAWTP